MQISTKNVDFVYESASKKALDNVSITLNYGEKIVLLGANGCGKTTLLKILCGLYKPTRGEILIDGRGVIPSPTFSFLVGYVPENPIEMFFEATVEREIEFILKRKKLPDEERIKKTVSIMEKFDLLKLRNNTPFELSAGERKKLAIAANIVAEQRFILLDEPTADLDFNGIKVVEKFVRESECGIISSTHRTDFAALFDRVVLMNSGHIIEQDLKLEKSRHQLERAGVVLLKRL